MEVIWRAKCRTELDSRKVLESFLADLNRPGIMITSKDIEMTGDDTYPYIVEVEYSYEDTS